MMTLSELSELRKFDLLLGNPLVKVATYEAYSEEEAWDYAREEFGGNTFFADADLREVMSDDAE